MLHKFKILTPLAMIICLLMMLNITPSFANEAEPASCKTLGDSNGDGEVDYLDAMLILQYHTGVIGEDDLILLDCQKDGHLNANSMNISTA